ncbi:E1 protein [Iotapapillomavirus 1]|uniref:Replication protein E1 n=1 Tax=Mastomys natalensis papillomavirus (isolate African multimammate rat) TaxID=654915 RepID=VE1_MNPVA|nr:E1 protein [Iotapapillomavirus 1]Q84356.1 RecName: Full=Replication protein E1; AltName: Full=ATP-dependent helicase E1 [Mastomys natalensis papillomavirus (isolate African multimammate rat)]AAA67146.1 E1 protein [Iotapapillomavirus 1]
MEDLEEGTGEGCSGWFDREAICSDGSSDEEPNESFESIADMFDDGTQTQGNSLELFHTQEKEETRTQIQALKRKYIPSPEAGGDLSPRLRAISITPKKKKPSRRLFETPEDSGNGSLGNETTDTSSGFQVVGDSAVDVCDAGRLLNLNLLQSHNRVARLLAVFKEAYGVSYKELTREYKSDKTCNPDWVIALYSLSEPILNAARTTLQGICEYVFMQSRPTAAATVALLTVRFKCSKSRETVRKQMCGMFHSDPLLCLCDPPKVQSVPAALYWYKSSMYSGTFTHGEAPEWIKRQTMITCAMEETKFDLSEMVQWAYDNNYEDESQIAFEYARTATESPNANAWLASNAQAKHVRDCATMVRHYKRAEMKAMSMSQWVWKCCREEPEEGTWTPISLYLASEGVEVIRFLSAMKSWLRGIPKKNCLVFYGPPNTGKSLFTMSLIKFLRGRVISFANSKSHFWMQPLAEAKVVLLDDATRATWDYVDTYMRNAMDGNPLSIDCKYRTPVQVKCPPMLVTTNEDVHLNDRWRYLHSRIQVFHLKEPMPIDTAGNPEYSFSNRHWKAFFEKLQKPLDLSEDEGDPKDNGEHTQPFSCCARGTDVHV